jgi:hypothetical protein
MALELTQPEKRSKDKEWSALKADKLTTICEAIV